MNKLSFWKSWTVGYRRIFWVCTVLVLVACEFMWTANVRSPSPVLTAERFQEAEIQELPIHTFRLGSLTLSISADTYIVLEHVLGGALRPNAAGSYTFLGLILLGTVLLLSLITTLKRFWFYSGMGLFILLVVSLRLEALELFGLTNKIPVVIVLLIYGVTAYYFQFVNTSASFLRRLLLFLSLTVFIGVTITYGAHIPQPLYSLSGNLILAGTLLTVLFIFTVAHEIIASFITLLTQGKKPTRSLPHFMLVTVIYLVNLGLIYADKKHLIEWDFFPFSLFILLTLSAILGLWGFRQREVLYEGIIKADPWGTYLYLSLAMIGLATTGYFVSTANDPAVQFLQDAILYSHLGYGIIFLVYIIVNFFSLLGNNMPVYKVLYKPASMPYFTFRLAGLIATFAFFAYSNYKVSINQVYAAYYNAVGDYYLAQDTLLPAESYYQRSLLFATRNYHAHYAVAEMMASRWEFEKEKKELDKLANGRPLDLAYLNYSRLYEVSHAWPEAIQVLRLGLKDFPKNGLLQNAMGLNYSKLEYRDSAVMMINKARHSSLSKAEAETNLMGISARFRVTLPVDSLRSLLDSGNPGVISNSLVLATFQKKVQDISVDPGQDTVLNIYSATAINNYLINHHSQVDTAFLSKVVALGRRPINAPFKNILLAAAAHVWYEAGETNTAFRLMHEVAFLGQLPQYYHVLGLWSLEQGSPGTAVGFFDQALNKNYHDAALSRALALNETGDLPHALKTWDSLSASPTLAIRHEATRMKKLLTFTPSEASAMTSPDQYDYSRLRFTLSQQEDFEKFIAGIKDPDLKAHAIVDRSRRMEEADEPMAAIRTLGLASGLRFSDKKLLEDGQHIHLRSLVRLKRWNEVSQQVQSGITFDGVYQQEKLLIDALIGEQAGKRDERKFNKLATVNPFFEDGVVEAARVADENASDRLKAYTILINALDRNPLSVKLLKAHFVQAAHLDFDESAKESLDKLHRLLSREAFIAFAKENPDIFDISQH